jgi:hypothetical protein
MENLLRYRDQYKQGNYQAAYYKNKEEIISACLEGKTFVFPGGRGALGCVCCTIMFELMFGMLYFMGGGPGSLWSGAEGWALGLAIALLVLTVFFLVVSYRAFIVAGPDGLLYRGRFKMIYFDWSSIRFIQTTRFINGAHSMAAIRIYPTEGGKYTVVSTNDVTSREIPRVQRDVLIPQAVYAHWAMKTKLDQARASVAELLKDPGNPFDLKDPNAPT